MGITGLLQNLKFLTEEETSVRDFTGMSLAIDASSWLHKSVYPVADRYVESVESSSPTAAADAASVRASSSYVQGRCHELLTYAGVSKIYFVLDGKRCPLKAGTNEERDRRRRDNLAEARRYKQLGDKERMHDKYRACIKVTEQLADAVADELERKYGRNNAGGGGRVVVVRSPYEADAQLVKLCLDGDADAVVTEDSDVLVYQAACRFSFPILYKLDRNSGRCSVVSVDWLLGGGNSNNNNNALQELSKNGKKKSASSGLEPILQAFATREARTPGLGARLFVQACVLAGCDYSPNQLAGVGLITAFKHVQSSIHRASEDRFRHALNFLPSKTWQEGVDKIEYEELLAKSEAVFYYHPVVDSNGRIAYLTDASTTGSEQQRHMHVPSLDRFGGDWSFLGSLSVESKPKDDHNANRKRGLPCGDEVPKAFAAMANPYAKAATHQHGKKRKPLESKSETASAAVNNNKKNPFSRFSHNRQRKPAANNNDVRKQPKKSGPLDKYRSSKDVRFVKRDFSKDGGRPKTFLAAARQRKKNTQPQQQRRTSPSSSSSKRGRPASVRDWLLGHKKNAAAPAAAPALSESRLSFSQPLMEGSSKVPPPDRPQGFSQDSGMMHGRQMRSAFDYGSEGLDDSSSMQRSIAGAHGPFVDEDVALLHNDEYDYGLVYDENVQVQDDDTRFLGARFHSDPVIDDDDDVEVLDSYNPTGARFSGAIADNQPRQARTTSKYFCRKVTLESSENREECGHAARAAAAEEKRNDPFSFDFCPEYSRENEHRSSSFDYDEFLCSPDASQRRGVGAHHASFQVDDEIVESPESFAPGQGIARFRSAGEPAAPRFAIAPTAMPTRFQFGPLA